MSGVRERFQSGGGINATEARQLMMLAVPMAKGQQISNEHALVKVLEAEGLPTADAQAAAHKIHDVWSKANTSKAYNSQFAKENGGQAVIAFDPASLHFPVTGSVAAQPASAVLPTVPVPSLDARLATVMTAGRVDHAAAVAIISDAGGATSPTARGRILEGLIPYTTSQADAAVLASQIMDVAAGPMHPPVTWRPVSNPATPSGVQVRPDTGAGLDPAGRTGAIRTALATNDVATARGVCAGAGLGVRAAIMDGLLKEPTLAPAVGRILATDPQLADVLGAAGTTTDVRRLVTGATDVILPSLAVEPQSGLTPGEAQGARDGLTEYFTGAPARLDTVLANVSSTVGDFSKGDLAKVILPGFAKLATPNTANYARLTGLLEHAVGSAGGADTERRDLTRAIRRVHYSDTALQFVGFDMGTHEPSAKVTGAVNDIASSLGHRWKEIPGSDGKDVDVSHALVAADAYMNASTVAAWVFTDFGDFMSGALSKIGVTGAGDDNEPDNRGNDMGERIYDRISAGSKAPLSELLQATAP